MGAPKFTALEPVHVTVDPKGRIGLPIAYVRKMAEFFDPPLVLPTEVPVHFTASGDGCIELLPPSVWEKKCEQLENIAEELFDSDRLRAQEARRILMMSSAASIDRQGRLRLPEVLCEYAGIKGEEKQVTIAGFGNRIQFWEKSAFVRYTCTDRPAPVPAAPAVVLLQSQAPVPAVLPAPAHTNPAIPSQPQRP